MSEPAKIYRRKNGTLGSSCDGCADTGHFITEEAGLFRVYGTLEDELPLVSNATREEAERAVEIDWRIE